MKTRLPSYKLIFPVLVKSLFLISLNIYGQPFLPEKRALAIFTPAPPQIDGLVDPAWLKAPMQNSFIQREPHEGVKARNQTRFYIMYDKKNVYFLFILLDEDAASVPSRLVERDQQFNPDDHINFYLDTYNDQRKAYFFSTNPAGVEQDGLVSENGNNIDMTWDGIFKVAARKNDYGWVAEFAVPYTTLRFTDQLKYQVWGFNAWRVRKKNREISYWSLVTQDYKSMRLDKGGVLIGMEKIKSGQNLQLLPYFTGRKIQGTLSTDNDFTAGIDIKYGLNSDLTLDITLNPDFGQVEIDEEQINLDKRYEILLEEKRPFFLENTNLFQTPYYPLFYSRRIGGESEIKAGAKLTGKISDFSIGVMEAYTGGWENFGLGNPDTPPRDELFSVVRLQADVLSNSNVGFMYVDRAADLGGINPEYNRAAGLDATFHSGQFYVLGQGVYTYNSFQGNLQQGVGGWSQAGYYGHLYRSDTYLISYTPDFNLDNIGFFPKVKGKGRTHGGSYMDIHPFISFGIIRSWGLGIEPTFIKDSDEVGTGWGIISKAWLELRDQSLIKIGLTRYRDYETDNYFSLFRPSLEPEPELSYWGSDFYAELITDISKPLSLVIRRTQNRQYYFQTHSTGFSRGWETFIRVKPASNAFIEMGFQNQQFLDNDMNFMPVSIIGQPKVRIWSLRGRYLFTKDIFTRLFFQQTNGAEDFVKAGSYYEYQVWDRMSSNALLGWRFRPGSTLYLAYTEEWDKKVGDTYSSTNRILYLKLLYLWSF